MTRISNDIYKNGKLWCGYDYDKQIWIYEGKEDTRTLKELKACIEKPYYCCGCGKIIPAIYLSVCEYCNTVQG